LPLSRVNHRWLPFRVRHSAQVSHNQMHLYDASRRVRLHPCSASA
jgi:hypothetical protein